MVSVEYKIHISALKYNFKCDNDLIVDACMTLKYVFGTTCILIFVTCMYRKSSYVTHTYTQLLPLLLKATCRLAINKGFFY